MPIRVEKFFVVRCPVCKNRLDFNGEGGFTVMTSRKDALEWLYESTGLCRGNHTIDELVTEACSKGKGCASVYRHRHCEKRPCGYCRSKQKANKGSQEAHRETKVGGDR